MGNSRLEKIDSLKGFAIVLVVIGHCLVGYLNAGLFKEIEHIMKFVNDFIYSFHMPLFFVISGFLFYYSYQKSDFNKVRNKIFDFIIIYFFYSVIQIIVQIIMSGRINQSLSIKNILMLPVYTIAPYWYLYVLVFLYLISYKILNFDINKVLLASFGLCIASGLLPHIKLFSLSNVAYYMFFFTLGGYLCICKVEPKSYTYLIPIVSAIYLFLYSQNFIAQIPKSFVAILITVFVWIVFDYCSFLNNRLFKWCGEYCLPIYLLHVYLTAGTRVVLKHIGLNDFYLYVFTGTVLGIIVPIVIYKICMQSNALKIFFQPVKTLQKYGNIKE